MRSFIRKGKKNLKKKIKQSQAGWSKTDSQSSTEFDKKVQEGTMEKCWTQKEKIYKVIKQKEKVIKPELKN